MDESGQGAVNISGALRTILSSEGLEALQRAAQACTLANADSYLVGGSVRDALLGRTDRIADLDLIVAGADGPALDSIAAQVGEVISRSEFMTLKVSCGNLSIDLVRARSETYESPGALPEVRPGTLEQDLARRDFTINAMAASLKPARWGDLIDPHEGRNDLERGLIRTLHDRSFEDDPTRMFRAARYAGRLGFDLAPETRSSLKSSVERIAALSGDRIRHELEHIFAEPGTLSILAHAHDESILKQVHPALEGQSSALARVQGPDLPDDESRGAVLLAALLWDASNADRLAISRRLNLGASDSKLIAEIGDLKDASHWLSPESSKPSRIRARLASFSGETLEACALLTNSDLLRTAIRLYLDRLRHVRPMLTGADLIALGVPEGPVIGELLDQLRDARLDGTLTTRQDEQNWVHDQLKAPDS